MVRLDHINMSVEDLQKSLTWYKNVFDFDTVEKGKHNGTPFAIVKSGESMLCMYQLPDRPKPETSKHHKIFHFGLRISDPQQWEERMQDLNIEPNLVWDYPHSKSWYVSDPSGHEIEVCYWQNDRIQFEPIRDQT